MLICRQGVRSADPLTLVQDVRRPAGAGCADPLCVPVSLFLSSSADCTSLAVGKSFRPRRIRRPVHRGPGQ